MIILLVLLPALVLSEESLIEWDKCVEYSCFCLGDGPTLALYQHSPNSDIAKCKDVGMQHKFFSEDSALFQIQVMGADTNQLGDAPELKVYYGPQLLFGCKMEKGQVVLIVEEENREFVKNSKISLFEERSRFKQGIVLCSIKTKSAKTLYDSLKFFTIMIKINSKEYPLQYADRSFFKKTDSDMAIKCDPESFKNIPSSSQEFKILPLRNTDKDVLNCDNYAESSSKNFYTFKYQKSFEDDHEIDQLECKMEENDDDYYYYVVKKDPATQLPITEKIADPESYFFYCSAKMEELCKNPVTCAPADPLCPVYTEGSRGGPATLTCPQNKWLIKGGYYDLSATPVACKKHEYNDVAVFSALLYNGEDDIKPDTMCFKDYDCVSKSHISLPKSDVIDITDVSMKCKDESSQLTILHAEGVMNTSTSYTCDKNDGQWKNGSEIVPVNSRVICKRTTEPPPAQAKPKRSDSEVMTLVGGLAAGIIGGFLLVAIGGYCCWKHRKDFTMKNLTIKKMSNMERSELVADCKEDFAMYLQATPQTDDLIVDGLKKIDEMLRNEVEEPEAWDEAYKFMMRFHGSIRKADRAVWHMYSRYLYLEAKKIIDKHGWSAPTPIRNSAKKGLIRAVAIRLLSLSVFDKAVPEAEELVWTGFRELGFKGVSQYPHCGLLWSLVFHSRPERNRLKSDPKALRCFDYQKFESRLLHVLKSKKVDTTIPRAELIPTFGSVPHQAAFAMGALPDNSYLTVYSGDIFFKQTRTVSTGFFEGLCQSIMHNPIENLLSAMRLLNPSKTVVDKIHKAVPADELAPLVKEGERVVTYYGRHLDAKRMHERFMLDEKDADFFKMQMEQHEFEGAVEGARSDLRSFFVPRIDKEELKKKPVDFTNPKIKLDKPCGEWVPAPKPLIEKPAKKAKPAGSAPGSSSSSGGSNSSDGKAPQPASDPKDAAAPAAAAPAAAAAPPSN